MDYFQFFLDTPDPEAWVGFPELVEQLGFTMDCSESFNRYLAACHLHMNSPHSKRTEKRNNLYALENADRQIVGNYLFSYWRFLTHWAGPYDSYEVDYLRRIISILKPKL